MASLESPQALGNPAMDVRTLPAVQGLDLFMGCFQLAPFVCWDGGFKASCAGDTRAQPFLHQREFARKYKPRIAILLASDYEDLHPEPMHYDSCSTAKTRTRRSRTKANRP